MSLNIISRYDFLHSELDWNAPVWNIHYDTWLSNATFDDKKLFAGVFSAYVSIKFLNKGKRQRHNQCIELRGPERDDNIDALFYLNSV